jgi:hypothetical protein
MATTSSLDRPLALGLLGAFRVAPVIVLAIGGGVAADSLDRRRLMLVTQTLLTVTSTLLAVLSRSGRATPALIYGTTAISAATSAFDNPLGNGPPA